MADPLHRRPVHGSESSHETVPATARDAEEAREVVEDVLDHPSHRAPDDDPPGRTSAPAQDPDA